MAIWTYQVARRCARRGHEVFVFASWGRLFRETGHEHENVQYIQVPTGLNRILNRAGRTLARARYNASFAASWRDAGYGIEVARRLRRLKCDAVLVMNFSQLVPIIRRQNPQIKIYLSMHCEWLTQLNEEMIRKRLQLADVVAGCSEFITATTINRFPEFSQICTTLPNGAHIVDGITDRFRESHRVLFVGRLSPEKGLHDLIEAFHGVLTRFPMAQLDIVGRPGSAPLEYLVGLSRDPRVAQLRRFYLPSTNGQDPYLTYLERAAGVELGHRIVFHGEIAHDRLAAVYQRAALLVNPSLSESFGMTLVEAMMHGIPVVATTIGGMPYIVNSDETGLLVEAADPSALESAICHLLADQARARRMGARGRARALDRFTWERVADTLLQQLQALVH